MFTDQNGIIRFEAKNESEKKLLKYIKRKNGWSLRRKFNTFKDNNDGTVTLFLEGGHTTDISKERISEVIGTGNVCRGTSRFNNYAMIFFEGNVTGLHRFLMRDELALYDGFFEETGMKIVVNHLDEVTSNNTDDNLEVVTNRENILKGYLNKNKGYTEVPNGKFVTKFQGKYVGTFDTKEEAHDAYAQVVKAELKRLGDIRINWLKSKGRL